MSLLLAQLTIDCDDPACLAAWWAQALGWQIEHDPEEPADPDEVWIEPADGPPRSSVVGDGILFITVPEPKAVKNRLHLDLRPADGSDQAAEVARLIAMGATHVDVGQGEVSWVVLADPEGNEFCVLRKTPGEVAAEAAADAHEPGLTALSRGR